MRRAWLMLVVVGGGCLHVDTQHCSDGAMCLIRLRCADAESGTPCVPESCGNGRLDPGELCDDGNNRPGESWPAWKRGELVPRVPTDPDTDASEPVVKASEG